MKYSVGDKVFAKVRGYPPWPARVEAVDEPMPNKFKYHVFFYGTLETAVCKSEVLYSYAEFKENYGKPSKRKWFNEGLAQIEGRAPVPELSRRTHLEKSEGESISEHLIIDENPPAKHGKQMRRKRDRAFTSENGHVKQGTLPRGSDILQRHKSLPLRLSQKRFKKDITSSNNFQNVEGSSNPKAEIVSRSGRIIKPKRFADNETFNCLASMTRTVDVSGIEEITEQSNEINSVGKEKAGKKNENLDLLKRVKERRRKPLEFWNKELQMLKCVGQIKSEFSILKANPRQGLNVLDEFIKLDIQPLMLKKNPDVVQTIEMLVKYTGNPTECKYCQDQKSLLMELQEKVRNKAKVIMDKFANVLNVPVGKSFHDFFGKCVLDLQTMTKGWPENSFYALTEDPTIKHRKNLKKVQGVKQLESDKSHSSNSNSITNSSDTGDEYLEGEE